MKKILITGKNSYIGTQLFAKLSLEPQEYIIESISLRNQVWKDFDFSSYDVVVHVAGIAHIKETKNNISQYFEINRDLSFEVAKKAKKDGVKQFVFLSSMSVYGLNSGIIRENTMPTPKTAYGKSKLEAEHLIQSLSDKNFVVCILRPPMVYGKSCKGNYSKLRNIVLLSPVFPKVDNKRSMIYIENLTEFIKLIIDDKSSGIYYPQNMEYVNTSVLVELIAKNNGKSVRLTTFFNSLIKYMKFSIMDKIFGTLIYEKEMSVFNKEYRLFSLEKSVEKCELKEN